VVGSRTGVGQATAGLLAALARAWPEAWPPPLAWINSPRHPVPTGDPWARSGRIEIKRTRFSGKALLRGWQWLDWPPVERWLGPIDLVHAPSGVVPSARRARRLVTVHDLYFRHRPEHTDAYGGRYFAATYGRRLALADRIACVSEFTRSELLRFYPGLDPARVDAIHWGVDFERFSPEPSPDDARTVAELGLDEPYVICVATHEPRKNLPRLLEGHARWLATRAAKAGGDARRAPLLVIVGGQGWGDARLERRARAAGVADRVRMVGYQPSERMPALYRRALAMIFPTVYEGFGLPALEAMACGCPCALARVGALLEVAGEDAAAWLDPLSAESIAGALEAIVSGQGLRERLREAGLARARRFTWEATARRTLDAYRAALA
jgi:glycosyltransferase involved in cell wall biosynthesis